MYTVEPLIKDTLNIGHLCIEHIFQHTNLYSGNIFYLERGQPLYNGQNAKVCPLYRGSTVYILCGVSLDYYLCVCDVTSLPDEGGANVIVQQLIVEPKDHESFTLELTGKEYTSTLVFSGMMM